MFNFWWKWSKQKTSTEMQKNGPLSHQKIKCSFLDYVQLLMIGQVIWAKNVDQTIKNQKKPPKLSKNKMFIFGLCSTSDDGQVIWAKNVPNHVSHQKIKCSDDSGQAIQAKNIDQNVKKQKRPPKSLKNKMFIFGLCSTSDDPPSDPSKKHRPKCIENKKGPLSHQNLKCSFLDYVQLLMISQAIWARNIDRNAKKAP